MNELEDIRLAVNPERRCPCVLLLDISDSMNDMDREPITALNNGLQLFQEDISQDEVAKLRVEIAIVTFGKGGVQVTSFRNGKAELVPDSGMRNEFFVQASEFQAPYLEAGGNTPMGQAINRALDLLRERKNQYEHYGILYYRPWVFLITDGQPTDEWKEAAKRVRAEDNEKAKGVVFFAVGVPPNANMQVLSEIAVRQPVMLKGLESFGQMFLWLSESQRGASRGKLEPGSQNAINSPSGWAFYTS